MGKDPKKFDFQAAIRNAVKDQEKADEILENIDIEKIKKPIDEEYVNPIVGYRQEQARETAKKEGMADAQKDVFTQLGLEADNIDGAKAQLKRLQADTSEKDEAYNRLEKQNKELAEKTQTFEQQLKEAQESANRANSVLKMDEFGVKKDYREDVYDLAQKRVSEDKELDDVLKDMRESHSAFFETADAGAGVNPDDDKGGNDEESEKERLAKRYGL